MPYPVPCIHLSTFKKELDHLVSLGMLIPQKEREWASPSFIIPKKDGRVCWISNLHQLNKWIKHKQYPLQVNRIPIVTKLDISMPYYTYELDAESQDTIIMPFGKYKDLPISELPIEYVYWLIDRLNEKPTFDSGLYLALVERIS